MFYFNQHHYFFLRLNKHILIADKFERINSINSINSNSPYMRRIHKNCPHTISFALTQTKTWLTDILFWLGPGVRELWHI